MLCLQKSYCRNARRMRPFTLLGRDIESCFNYHRSVVAGVGYHALLAAVYTAFSDHRPLVLGPDAVWITILQGVAHHMAIHADRLRRNSSRMKENSIWSSMSVIS